MKLYTRYLLSQLTLPVLIATLAFSGAVWLSQSLRFVDLIVNKGLPVTTFLYLTLLLFPSLLTVILPVALFSAVLFVYHRLLLESEVTAMLDTYFEAGIPAVRAEADNVRTIGDAVMAYFTGEGHEERAARAAPKMQLVVALVLSSALYTVREGRQAIVLQFGQPVGAASDAGLKVKVPFIQDVVYFDKRVLDFDAERAEMATADQKQVEVDA